MRICPKCRARQIWKLADGRFKCRKCRHRFTWTSVWDSVRLRPAQKQRLLERFALGVPSRRLRFDADVSAKSRERFYRLVRGCCAQAECAGSRDLTARAAAAITPLTPGALRSQDRRAPLFLVVMLRKGRAQALLASAIDVAAARSIEGAGSEVSVAQLAVRGGRIVLKDGWLEPLERFAARRALSAVDSFWNFALEWLAPYGSVPLPYLCLYVGEACFRFNHRNSDLQPLLLRLMKQTGRADIEEFVSVRPSSDTR